VAHTVFTHAFVDAMRPTLILPITIVVVAALGCFAVRSAPPRSSEVAARPKEAVA
jgi:hypothetical protein